MLDPARTIALTVEGWLVGIRAQLSTNLKAKAANARKQRRTITDWDDLRTLSTEVDGHA
jgi:hypothetical protein